MLYMFRKYIECSIWMLKKYSEVSNLSRTFTTSKVSSKNYEGDGKTIVTFINKEHKHLIMVDSLSSIGFRLNNGIFVIGPLAVFPRTVLQWNVNCVEDVTPDSLSLFCLLEPKLDMLIIGTGDNRIYPTKNALQYLKSNKITTEILPTYQACSIFNFLNAEGRYVAGAFIPPQGMAVYSEELKILESIEAMDDYEVAKPPKIKM